MPPQLLEFFDHRGAGFAKNFTGTSPLDGRSNIRQRQQLLPLPWKLTLEFKLPVRISRRCFHATQVYRSLLRVSGQCSHECFLWNVDRTDSIHALLTSLLLFQKLALTRNIAAVALRQHVLTHSANILTADDFRANGRLNRN